MHRTGSVERDRPRRIAGSSVDEEAELVVVGLPLSMTARSGPAAKAASTEARPLATVVGVPVETYDERFTTVTADEAMIEAGHARPGPPRVVDKVAAAVMLQAGSTPAADLAMSPASERT